MSTRFRKTLAVLIAALVVASGAGAAAIAWDTETTSTSTQSDVSGASTTVDFYPGNDSKTIHAEVDGASTSNLSLEMTPATKGVDYVVYENDTPTELNASAGHYGWNITHDALTEIPRTSTGGTYNVSIINTSNDTAVLTTEVTLDSDGIDESRAIMVVSDESGTDAAALTPLVADQLTLSTEEAGWLSLSSLSLGAFGTEDNGTQIAEWSGYTTVNGSNTDVTVKMANSSAATAYDDAASSRDDGEAIKGATVFVNGIPHLVYKNEAPEDYPDNATLVTYDATADELQIETGPEYKGVGNLNVRATAGTGYSFGELWSNFGITKALQVTW